MTRIWEVYLYPFYNNMDYSVHGSKIWLFCKKFTYFDHFTLRFKVSEFLTK